MLDYRITLALCFVWVLGVVAGLHLHEAQHGQRPEVLR